MGPGGISVPMVSGRCVALLGPDLLRGWPQTPVCDRHRAPDLCLSSYARAMPFATPPAPAWPQTGDPTERALNIGGHP